MKGARCKHKRSYSVRKQRWVAAAAAAPATAAAEAGEGTAASSRSWQAAAAAARAASSRSSSSGKAGFGSRVDSHCDGVWEWRRVAPGSFGKCIREPLKFGVKLSSYRF